MIPLKQDVCLLIEMGLWVIVFIIRIVLYMEMIQENYAPRLKTNIFHCLFQCVSLVNERNMDMAIRWVQED